MATEARLDRDRLAKELSNLTQERDVLGNELARLRDVADCAQKVCSMPLLLTMSGGPVARLRGALVASGRSGTVTRA